MYKVEVDHIRRLIVLTASGVVSLNEVIGIQKEFYSVLKKYRPKEYFILGNLSDLIPASHEVIKVIEGVQMLGSDYGKKLATIYGNWVGSIQEMAFPFVQSVDDDMGYFTTEEEAMEYLLG